jgi:hypothetical protein
MENGMFKKKIDIDRHCPRLMPNICKNLNPSYFSLPSTFKAKKRVWASPIYSLYTVLLQISR